MTKLVLYEKSPILLAYLLVAFKKNSTFDLVSGCINRKEIIETLSSESVDILILSHQGVLDISTIHSISSLFPSVRLVSIYYDETVFKKISYPKLNANRPKNNKDISVDEYLLDLQSIHFMKEECNINYKSTNYM